MALHSLKVENELLVKEAAELIGAHSSELARLWLYQPFSRWKVATVFARCFLKGRDPAETDPHPHALLVQRIALRDREQRRMNARIPNTSLEIQP